MSLKAINNRLKQITGEDGTITDNLTFLVGDIQESYEEIDAKGGILPLEKNTENLPEAILTLGES